MKASYRLRRLGMRIGMPLATVACFLTGSRPCQASVTIPQVTLTTCPEVSADDFNRFLKAEVGILGELPPDIGEYTIAIECLEDSVHLSLQDSRHNERLRRSISAPHKDGHETARTVALSAAELLLAWNWVPQSRPAPTPSQTPQGTSGGAPRKAPPPPVVSAGRLLSGELSLGGVGTFRSLSSEGLNSLGGSLGAGVRHRSGWGTHAGLSLLRGRESRDTGIVLATGTTISLGASFLSLGTAPIKALLRAEAGASVITITGQATSIGFESGSITGWVPEAQFSGGPAFDLRSVQLLVLGTAGWTFSDLTAGVAGDTGVRYGGAYLGAGLQVLWRFDKKTQGVGSVRR